MGTARGLEAKLVPQAGYQLITLPVVGFSRSLNWRSVVFATKLSAGILKAMRILQRVRPKAVVGMGGYASFPLLLVASWQGYPCVIHEQNSVPGLANKVLASKVQIVATSFAQTAQYLKGAKKVVLVGNPIRPKILQASLSEAEKALGLKKERGQLYILVFGGSQGARKLNEVAFGLIKEGLLPETLKLINITGQAEAETYRQRQKNLPVQQQKQYYPLAYLDNIGYAYQLADLVVCRAGASTIAEVTAAGLPSILVPYPFATDGHQLKNAEILVAQGAARLINDEQLTVKTLQKEIKEICKPEILAAMRIKAKSAGYPEAAAVLAREILALT